MNILTLVKKDIQRRVISFSLKYIIIFSFISLIIPFINYFLGDSLDFSDYLGAINFIFPILLPILSVNFLIDDQSTRINDFFFKTKKDREKYLFSLYTSAIVLGIVAGILLIFFSAIFKLGFGVVIPWSNVLLSIFSYILCSTFFLSMALLLSFFVKYTGVTLMTITILLLILFPILISIGAPAIRLGFLFDTPFYLLTFLGIRSITIISSLYMAAVIIVLYFVNNWKIKKMDF